MRKNYDIYFERTDNKTYCSELVLKIYKETTGMEIGEHEKFSDFDLTNKMVQQKNEKTFRWTKK